MGISRNQQVVYRPLTWTLLLLQMLYPLYRRGLRCWHCQIITVPNLISKDHDRRLPCTICHRHSSHSSKSTTFITISSIWRWSKKCCHHHRTPSSASCLTQESKTNQPSIFIHTPAITSKSAIAKVCQSTAPTSKGASSLTSSHSSRCLSHLITQANHLCILRSCESTSPSNDSPCEQWHLLSTSHEPYLHGYHRP